MKLIIAVIKPFKIEEVTDALNQIGVSGVTLTNTGAFPGAQGTRGTSFSSRSGFPRSASSRTTVGIAISSTL